MKLIRTTLDLERRVQVMGILNVTPDSFSDGGTHLAPSAAVERALAMVDEGADIIDIGGESTRPASKPVTAADEIARIGPVFAGLKGRLTIPLSIDTTKVEVARFAIDHGAEIINDVSGLRFGTGLAKLASETGAALILMHSRGTPETMQALPASENILRDVVEGLRWSLAEALKAGVARDRVVVDPGIGFGKTAAQNLEMIGNLGWLKRELNLPILLGASRKSFIGRTLEGRLPAAFERDEQMEKLFGTIASVVMGVANGANIVRVHDVKEMVVSVRMAEALIHGEENRQSS